MDGFTYEEGHASLQSPSHVQPSGQRCVQRVSVHSHKLNDRRYGIFDYQVIGKEPGVGFVTMEAIVAGTNPVRTSFGTNQHRDIQRTKDVLLLHAT